VARAILIHFGSRVLRMPGTNVHLPGILRPSETNVHVRSRKTHTGGAPAGSGRCADGERAVSGPQDLDTAAPAGKAP